jgi:hypothetical protein
MPKIPVDCPLCQASTVLDSGAIETEPGYDLPPVVLDLGFRSVMATEHVPPRIVAINLECGCRVRTPPWVLVFPAPGVRPFFTQRDPSA